MNKSEQRRVDDAQVRAHAQPWTVMSGTYISLIGDAQKDSFYLRDRGLKKTILQLVGDCSSMRLLDAGCANGWLLDALSPAEGYGCDICCYDSFPSCWKFRQADIRALPYEDEYFDTTIASLVLLWFPELNNALSELRRVTKPGGQVIIALMNPYFYRMGEVDEHGNFVVTRDLSKPFVIEDHHIAGTVGPFPYHYRPLPEYLNACIRTGLPILKTADWYVNMEEFRARFGDGKPGKIRRTGRIPLYTFIKCGRA